MLSLLFIDPLSLPLYHVVEHRKDAKSPLAIVWPQLGPKHTTCKFIVQIKEFLLGTILENDRNISSLVRSLLPARRGFRNS